MDPQPLSFNDIAKLNLSQIVIFSKPPNIIATNISQFTVHCLAAVATSWKTTVTVTLSN